ncbi:MAG TPA: hypothetical protein DCZ91_20315 [Lachnospiraceae bacterium]|nr:hypothetical protein [Lachnospiraceae bacterium]
MPFFDGYELIRYAVDADAEDRLFLRWSIWYQSQMGFAEFKTTLGAPRYQDQVDADVRTAEEILKDVKAIVG